MISSKIYVTDSSDAIVGDFTKPFYDVESTNYASLKNNNDNTKPVSTFPRASTLANSQEQFHATHP